MVKDYGLETITTGIAAEENVLKADSRGRLRMFGPNEGMLFGNPALSRRGLASDGLGRLLAVQPQDPQ